MSASRYQALELVGLYTTATPHSWHIQRESALLVINTDYAAKEAVVGNDVAPHRLSRNVLLPVL